jgi:flagellar biosynthesis chaperone FliJ
LALLKSDETTLIQQLQAARAEKDAADHTLHDNDGARKNRMQQIDLKMTNIRALVQNLRSQIDVQLARCVQLGYKI